MSKDGRIRWGWLKGMYIYTIAGAGMFGLGMLAVPEVIQSVFNWPVNEPIAFGVIGSVYLAFGLLSILGLRSPLKFVPLLVMQLCYKSIWLLGLLLPLVIRGQFPAYGITMVIIFATYIIGDLIAIPFSVVLAKEAER